MALIISHSLISFMFFILLAISSQLVQAVEKKIEVPFNRSIFPVNFVFGAASSAFQYEGAVKEGGRGPSIWDTFTHLRPEMIVDRSNADIAEDSYHRYKEDIGLLKGMNMDAYRFSISWSRILPKGTLKGGINKEGIEYYNNFINELVSKGLQPFATLFHWDLPQSLESDYLGLLSPHFVDDYRDYAELCFKEFGDRVKHWISFNEPWAYCQRGYSDGLFAPGRCSPGAGNCTAGNSSTEPYLCAHHTILAHATAAQLYRTKYKPMQKGKIGITLLTHWFLPYSNSKADEDAAGRAIDFMFGWFLDPLTQGDYPFTMRAIVGDRLPVFSPKQTMLIKGSLDFLGVNYYTTYYARSISLLDKPSVISYDTDSYTFQTGVRGGVAIGPEAASAGIYTYPKGLRDLMIYVKEKYNRPEVFITETGTSESGDSSIPLNQALKDFKRIEFYRGHIYYLHRAISEGANVKGLFAWSLLDNWEWTSGYSVRFGIVYIDRLHDLKRHPKASYYWVQKFLKP